MNQIVRNVLNRQLTKTQRAFVAQTVGQVRFTLNAIRRDNLALLGLFIVIFHILVAVFAPVLAPYDPQTAITTADGIGKSLYPPSAAHPFGTTTASHDVLSQWIYGSRISIFVGLFSGATVMVIGTTVGLISGYYKGVTDVVLMRIVDILYGTPVIPLILILALLVGGSIWNIFLAFGIILWRGTARVVRSQTLSLSEREFVKAARATGASESRIIFLHIAPNVFSLVMIQTIITIGAAISLEAALSFLGVGVQDAVSWGTMLQMTFATGAIRTAWWWVLPPGISITLIVVSLFYISRALEVVTNPDIDPEVR